MAWILKNSWEILHVPFNHFESSLFSLVESLKDFIVATLLFEVFYFSIFSELFVWKNFYYTRLKNSIINWASAKRCQYTCTRSCYFGSSRIFDKRFCSDVNVLALFSKTLQNGIGAFHLFTQAKSRCNSTVQWGNMKNNINKWS